MPDPVEQKRILRRQCFEAVKKMTRLEKATASAKICQRISELDHFKRAQTVFAYLPLKSEPDLRSLIAASKSWAFSRVLSDQSMEFREVANIETDVLEGDFKIMEPNPEVCPIISPSAADIIIIPGVGFSKKSGNRLGRGKGHYDRYLEKALKSERPPTLIGVCFEAQLCEVKTEIHDIPMNLVISG